MAEPIRIPHVLGQPCWTDANLEATIRTVAALGDESASRFLATHSPIAHVQTGKGERTLTDTKVFQAISRLSARENVVLIHGDPGTGKSHLINWVKLRYDHAIATGDLTNVLPVLVRRRSGSLKDALEQLVEQLPERFHTYVEPIRAAIARISEREARKKLATELHLELGIRREIAQKPPLPRTIRSLPEAFHSEGFGAWLCRDGGVIDRNIQQLISPTDVKERESFPRFDASEFRILDPHQRSAGLNTANVRRLIDEFEDEPSSAEQAAALCNDALRSALRELTGLGSAALSTILRSIRQDLRNDGTRLVLLIEDVSTLSVLDDEVVNAVEPQDDASLCDLTSVLGMTEQAFERLRDNQNQRIAGSGLFLSFPRDDTSAPWAREDADIDRFVARYLNATRLSDTNVERIAKQRQQGDDIGVSACDDCPVRDACHSAFGTVAFGDTIVGLFPFRPGTAPYLLDNLDVQQTGVRATQRGLLDFVAKPILRHVEGLAEGDRHTLSLAIRSTPPRDWQTLVETYLAGWGTNERSRVRLLAEAWTRKTAAADIASDLQLLLKPFHLPEFSSATVAKAAEQIGPEKAKSGPEDISPQPVEPDRSPMDPAKERRLNDLLNRLDRWSGNEKFENPGDFQEMLIAFLKNALPLDDIRAPAVSAQRLLREADRGAIRIEDSATQRARIGVSFTFNRNEANYNLMQALARFTVLGEKSWAFPEGERFKRVAARWLREHQKTMLAALDPVGLPTDVPVKLATKFLCLASIIERRANIPADTPAALAYVTSNTPLAEPTVLTEPLKRLFGDLPERRQSVQSFVVEETSVPQGSKGGINVIDPQLLIEGISEARSDLTLTPLPADYSTSYWKPRYQAIEGLKSWAGLADAIAAERTAIAGISEGIDGVLERLGFAAGDDYLGCVEFIAATGRLIDLLRSAFRWPVNEVEFFKRERLLDRAETFARTLSTAAAVARGSTLNEVLLFDPNDLMIVAGHIQSCVAIFDSAAAFTDSKLEHLTGDDDPDVIEREIVSELDRLSPGLQAAA
jgi:hypothetical protein